MNKEIYENNVNPQFFYTTSTKTQYAGPDAHMAVIKLLRYLKDKYLTSFELNDEDMYRETMDKNVLLKQFSQYEFLLNVVTESLSNMKAVPGESAASLADRIEEVLKKLMGKKHQQPAGMSFGWTETGGCPISAKVLILIDQKPERLQFCVSYCL